MTHLDITSEVPHDSQCLTEMIKQLSKNDLFLADLGYFDTEFLKKINEHNFFISRIKINLKLYKGVSESYSIYDEIDTVLQLLQKFIVYAGK
ncbi:transposase [Niameybacter sp.]|uniref:transposase n=1 Tax=Niameybacter sp. TaxID=2033640 RepID=UPI003FA58F1B